MDAKANNFVFDEKTNKLTHVCGVELLPFEIEHWTHVAERVREVNVPPVVEAARAIAMSVPPEPTSIEYELPDGTKSTVKMRMPGGSPFAHNGAYPSISPEAFNVLAVHVLQHRMTSVSTLCSSLKRAAEELMWIEDFIDAQLTPDPETLHEDLLLTGNLALKTYNELRAEMKKNGWEWYEQIPKMVTYGVS